MDLSKSECTVPGGLETLDLNDVGHDLEVHRDHLNVHPADLDGARDLKPVQDMEEDRSLEQRDRMNSGEDTDDSLTDPVLFSRKRKLIFLQENEFEKKFFHQKKVGMTD